MNDSRRDDRPTPGETTTPPDTPQEPLVGSHRGRPLHPPGPPDEDPTVEGDHESPLTNRLDPDLETPEMRPAVLGRLEGLGIMTTLHDASGELIDSEGTWRPADETATLDELRETFPEGSVTTFAGTLVEGRQEARTAEDVSMQVVIKRHGEYEDYDGRMLRVVNFVPREDAEHARRRDAPTPPPI